MKKLCSILLALLLLGALCTGVFASGDTPLVTDEAGVLTDEERSSLLSLAEEISERLQCDVAAALVGDIPDDAENSGKNYYDEHDFGYGPDYDGVLLLIDASDGDAWIASCGFGRTAFNDEAVDYVFECVTDAMSRTDDWAEGVQAYLKTADDILTRARAGETFTLSDSRDAPILTLGTGDAVSADAPLVVDDAGLLTERERESLLSMAQEISERQRCDVALVTVYSLEGKSPEAYADDYYDYRGYGCGANNDGILFLIAMEDRDWAISTTGYGIEAFTDYGQEYVIDCLIDDLSDGEYYDAFSAYFTACDELLTRAREGNPLDNYYGDDDYRGPKKSFGEKVKGQLRPGVILLSLVIGFVLALIPTAIERGKVKNVKWQQNATNYMREGSMRLNVNRDQFMYANTTSRRIETNRSGGHGGGSSTHVGSSGVTHGGSHGKF